MQLSPSVTESIPNGKVSHKQAKEKAEAEYDIFNRTQHIYSDFDKAVGLIDSRK